MHNYNEANEYLGGKSDRPLAGRATRLQRHNDGSIAVKYHATDVITFAPSGSVTLNSGGWHTATTKEKMVKYLPKPWTIYQARGVWYLRDFQTGKEYPFSDGITIGKRGKVSGVGIVPDANLPKRISRYATDFANAWAEGKIEAPSGGDCWYCALRDMATGKPMGDGRPDSHFSEHMDEGYYVPSLMVTAIEEIGASNFAKDAITRGWQGETLSEWQRDIAKRDISRAVRRYVRRQFGLA